MNKNELQNALNQEGISPDSYDLEGGLLPERYTLAEESAMWSVYYSERGLQTGKKTFMSESEACEYFLNTVRDDQTTRA